jgi:hypothetical protein
MSRTLKKADGDLYIDRETGRPEFVTGPSKVDQELADLYLTRYDAERDWGSEIQLENFLNIDISKLRAALFLRVQQANKRLLAKQGRDPALSNSEKIKSFDGTQVFVDRETQAGLLSRWPRWGIPRCRRRSGLTLNPRPCGKCCHRHLSKLAKDSFLWLGP